MTVKTTQRNGENIINLVELVPIVIAITRDNKHVYVNEAWTQVIGYTSDEAKSLNPLNLVHPDMRGLALQSLESISSSQQPSINIETKILTKSRGTLWFDFHAHIIDFEERKSILTVAYDITERKKVEEQLRYQATLLKNISDVIISADNEFVIQSWNTAAEKLYGWSAEEAIGKPFPELLNPIYPNRSRDDVIKEFNEIGIYQGEAIHHHKDGTQIQIRKTVSMLKDSDGKPIGVVAVNRDITQSKQVEQTLREREARLQSIFRAAPVGIGLVSNRVLLQVNERLCEMIGYSQDELVGQSARILYPSDEDFEYVGQAKYELIQEKGTGTVETHWQHKSGKVIDVLLSSTPLDLENLEAGVTFTALDITESVKAQNELKKLNIDLENRVKKRTKDLQILVDSMVGREVRMAELKTVIKKLRTQLEKAGLEPVVDDPLFSKAESE